MPDEMYPEIKELKKFLGEEKSLSKKAFSEREDSIHWAPPTDFELKGMEKYRNMPTDVPTYPAVFLYSDPINPYNGQSGTNDRYGPLLPNKDENVTKWDLLDDKHRTHLMMIFANVNCSECGELLKLASDVLKHFYLTDLKQWDTGYCMNRDNDRDNDETTDTPEAKEEA